MWNLAAWQDEPALSRAWHAAQPFPHVVIEDFVTAAALPALFEILDEEPVEHSVGDIFSFDATAPAPITAAFRELGASFGATLAPPLSRITGKAVRRAELRAYAYRPGHYLLPHSDHQDGLARVLAFAYYLPSPEPPLGGELELFRCSMTGAEITAVASATVLEPAANRMVIFDVSDVSLHQVREVLGGLRISLAGWFYA
ncbi:MAG: 2OG-Fe(II) oxygenase [Myxococcota bacterium]|nr:2OG-Fe(II) oxygenase [Myxococcota bacterium]